MRCSTDCMHDVQTSSMNEGMKLNKTEAEHILE